MDIKEIRKISLEFRRLSSNVLRTRQDEGNMQLIRFNNYINENNLISRLIENEISGSQIDYESVFCSKNKYSMVINFPIKRSDHLKAIYDYIKELTKEPRDLSDLSLTIYCSSKKYDDKIRNFLEKITKPLIDFVVDELSMEIMLMEDELKDKIKVNQYINQNYGSANIANGNITSNNSYSIQESQRINELSNKLLKLVRNSGLEKEYIEEYVDDIEVVLENVNSEKPKLVRLKKACKNILELAKKIPASIATAEIITKNSIELVEFIQNTFDKIG